MKVLNPHQASQPGDQTKELNLQGLWPWRPAWFHYRSSTGLGETTLPSSVGGHKWNLVHTNIQRKGAGPHRGLNQTTSYCWRVSCRGEGHQGLTTGHLRPNNYQGGSAPHPSAEIWIKALLSKALSTSLVQFSCSVVSNSLQPHGLQHARLPCPSPTPGIYSNSCPSSWWCHPTVSSSVILFSSHLQSFPASGSFPMSQLFTSGGQSIGVSASTSVLPMNIQDWSPLQWTGWISLQVQGTLKSLLQHHILKASILWHSTLFIVQLLHPHMTTGKTIALTQWIFVGKVMSLLFNMLSSLVIVFLPTISIKRIQNLKITIELPRK